VAGKGYFEFDYLGQMPGPGPARSFHYFVPRIVGLTDNIEAGVNVNMGTPKGFTQSDSAEREVKFFNNDDGRSSIAGRHRILRWQPSRVHPRFRSSSTVISAKSTGSYGPRFTAGPCAIIGPRWTTSAA
jgi:hypothetical protein